MCSCLVEQSIGLVEEVLVGDAVCKGVRFRDEIKCPG